MNCSANNKKTCREKKNKDYYRSLYCQGWFAQIRFTAINCVEFSYGGSRQGKTGVTYWAPLEHFRSPYVFFFQTWCTDKEKNLLIIFLAYRIIPRETPIPKDSPPLFLEWFATYFKNSERQPTSSNSRLCSTMTSATMALFDPGGKWANVPDWEGHSFVFGSSPLPAIAGSKGHKM